MLKTICYISDSKEYKSLSELNDIYLKARTNNIENNITGVLVYKNRNFLQVIEGESGKVNDTFSKIALDTRHKNIFKVINTSIEERVFEDYNFGFTTIDSNKELKNLYNYLEWLRSAENKLANNIISMVKNFIVHR